MTSRNKPTTRPVRIASRIPKPRLRFSELRNIVAGTQRRMAHDLGVTELTIRKIEQGRNDPSFMMSFVYAEYLGTTVYDIFPDIVHEAQTYLSSRSITNITEPQT
jgi:putative transcriptional regulator